MLNLKFKYIIIAAIFSAFSIVKSQAQNSNNYMTVTPTSVSFSLTSATAIESNQSITNAFTIVNRSRNGTYSVYVKISARSQSTTTPIPYNSLGVKLNTAPAGQTGNFNNIYLSTIDQLIIQGTATSGNGTHSWKYNLLLKPLGYSIKPGSYNFTLLFTMTQP